VLKKTKHVFEIFDCCNKTERTAYSMMTKWWRSPRRERWSQKPDTWWRH